MAYRFIGVGLDEPPRYLPATIWWPSREAYEAGLRDRLTGGLDQLVQHGGAITFPELTIQDCELELPE